MFVYSLYHKAQRLSVSFLIYGYHYRKIKSNWILLIVLYHRLDNILENEPVLKWDMVVTYDKTADKVDMF